MPTLRLLLFCGFFIHVASGWAIASDSVRIDEITIQGNKVTKSYIILRELDFEVGDYLESNELAKHLKQNQNQIFNTRLFNVVRVAAIPKDSLGVKIFIEVVEKWYIWPYPSLKLCR